MHDTGVKFSLLVLAITNQMYERVLDGMCEVGYEGRYPTDIRMLAREMLNRLEQVARVSGGLVILAADTELLIIASFVWDYYLPKYQKTKWAHQVGDILNGCIAMLPVDEINQFLEKLNAIREEKERTAS